jgi:type VI secretion system protein ImpH
MAGDYRATTDRLTWLGELERSPHAFDFHLVLRRLECMFRDRPRLGESVRPTDEPIRLGQEPSMAFAPCVLTSFRPPQESVPGRLTVSFFGLFGPCGPLPLHLTEYARDRLRNSQDPTFVTFADLFHHRMLLLFYRAWATTQPTVGQDRPGSNRFATYVGALFGLALREALGRDRIPDSAKLYYAPRLACPTRNAEGLRALVADYFGLPVLIEQFVGEWVALPYASRFRLNRSRDTSALGRTTVLGARIWLRNHKFRVVLGPLSRGQFQRMLPGSESVDRLAELVRAYVGDELAWDLRLILSADVSDQLELGRGGRLGWNARLGRSHPKEHPEDLIVDPLSLRTKRTLSRARA